MTLSIFAHNSSTISIPVAKQPIILDGLLNDMEWSDAFKFNFTSPRLHEGYVILYLKYELFDKALSGAFYIPDKTPFFNKTSPDQISFGFDTLHTASKTIEPDDHFIVFVRDDHAEYYRGGITEILGHVLTVGYATIADLETIYMASRNMSSFARNTNKVNRKTTKYEYNASCIDIASDLYDSLLWTR